MPKNERCMLVKVVVDVIILAVVGIPILIFHVSGVPYHRGFFCDDDSIRYPFKDSTVSNNVLYVVGVFLPVIAICLNEFHASTRHKRKKCHSQLMLLGRPIPPLAWEIYKQVGVFLFGACVSQLTTDIAKYSIGRLRPHFIYVCRPDLRIYCGVGLADQHEYVENYHCNGDPKLIREARLSFPSGHSSFSAYSMFYLLFYLQGCMHVDGNKLLKPFLQFILVMMTWSCALSRISDYKHHWSDVMIGFLLGFIVASIISYFVSDIFKPIQKIEDDTSSGNTISQAPVVNYNTMDLEQQPQQEVQP